MNTYVLSYEETDGCTYNCPVTIFLSGENETTVGLFILNKVEKVVESIYAEGIKNKNINKYFENAFIEIGEEQVSLENFVYYSSIEHKLVYNIELIPLEEFLKGEVINTE